MTRGLLAMSEVAAMYATAREVLGYDLADVRDW
jgi:hypothetical protein